VRLADDVFVFGNRTDVAREQLSLPDPVQVIGAATQ